MGERPWSHLADERDGAWADFAAWDCWMKRQMPDEYAAEFEAMGLSALKANIYSACCRIVEDVTQEAAR